ncbi:MAG: FAD-dependent monooxygenase [Chloroflexi bacterium]|nr:FAD-dependent monooxygenase [Chloroflexota bacterium]
MVDNKAEYVDAIVVGGGPGGVIFGYLAARAGLRVHLLEAQADFNREFRGDTLNPLALNLLEELGLIDEIMALPHGKVTTLRGSGTIPYMLSYDILRSKYPYVMILSQSLFLDFMVGKASQYPNFTIEMRARVNGLVEENGVIRGVEYRTADGDLKTLRAPLTIGADGRNSAIRKLADIETKTLTNQPDDIIWLRMPMDDALDPREDLNTRQDENNSLFMFRRPYERDWQIGVTVLKGSFKELRAQDIQVFRGLMRNLIPEFSERLKAIDWQDLSYLPVDLKRAIKWYRDGLLLIGDSAHIMSPVGGVGINLAIRDAVVAANLLVEPLKQGAVTKEQLAQVQRKVEWDIKITQGFQASIQNASKRTAKNSMGSKIGRKMAGWFTQIPLVKSVPVRMLAYGLVQVKVSPALLQKSA